MAEHPILFTGEMVRAILNDRKTQTRRVVKPQPKVSANGCPSWGHPKVDGKPRGRIRNGPRFCAGGRNVTMTELIGEYCPYGQPGDKLWVRERWRASLVNTGIRPAVKVYYRASPDLFNALLFEDDIMPPSRQMGLSWHSSRYMPR